MSKQYSHSSDRLPRLLWWLVGGLLLLGVLSLLLSSLLISRLEQWLEQRGLEVEVGAHQLSLPSLRVQLQNVEVRNAEGRGASAREVMLDYGWWQLLRGRLRAQAVYLDGVDFDLELNVTERGNQWEIAGWLMGVGGARKDREFQMAIDRLRIRNSRLCYRHRPGWQTASCVRFKDLSARDWSLSLHREGDAPMDLKIGARRLGLRDAVIQAQDSDDVHTAVVKLDLTDGLFALPDKQITADAISLSRMGSCLAERWTQVVPGFRWLVEHCIAARRLQFEGDILFSFGAGAEVRWQRGNGQAVKLRARGQRWQDWRAESVALDEFIFERATRKLSWQSGGASAFDWCPKGWRGRNQHLCVRAGTLQLPQPVSFDWGDALVVKTGPARLQQTQLLNVAGTVRDPLTVHDTQLDGLSYSGESRTLNLDDLDITSVSGCVRGELWQQPDHCLRLTGLHSEESLQVRFAARAPDRPWGVASGGLKLAQLRLQREGEPLLQLQKLQWQQLNFMRGTAPLLLQDFAVQSLRGCLPEGTLDAVEQSLCADLAAFSGEGTFAWQDGSDGYLILGALQAERALLSDRLGQPKGRTQGAQTQQKQRQELLLEKLYTGEGFFLRNADGENPWVAQDEAGSSAEPGAEQQTATDTPGDDAGREKGLLKEELARQQAQEAAGGRAPVSIASPNFKLANLSLSRASGCLPQSWAQLLYRRPQQMPTCVQIRNLRQHEPLLMAWGAGMALQVAELTLEQARAQTFTGRKLLDVAKLRVPRADLRIAAGEFDIALPGFFLQQFSACLPDSGEEGGDGAGGRVAEASAIECVSLERIQLGEDFRLEVDEREVLANLNGSVARRILLRSAGGDVRADLHKLLAPQLEVAWHRDAARLTGLDVDNLALEKLAACLPLTAPANTRVPRCLTLRELRSRGESGLEMTDVQLHVALGAPPQWQLARVAVDTFDLSAQALGLGAVTLEQLRGCNLAALLPDAAAGAEDCLRVRELRLQPGSRIGLSGDLPRVQLAALQTTPIAYGAEESGGLYLALPHLAWQQLQWYGGSALTVTDLLLQDFRGCLPVDKSGAPARCAELAELSLRGKQQLSLSAPFSVSGAIALNGLTIGSGADALRLSEMRLERPLVDDRGLETMTGSLVQLRGCISLETNGRRHLAPCYELGPIEFDAIERRTTPAGKQTSVLGLKIKGVRVRQADFPRGLPAELLQLEAVALERLVLGSETVELAGLRAQGVAGCMPRGYLEGIDHCLAMDSLDVSGQFRTASQQLSISDLTLMNAKMLAGNGHRLLQLQQAQLQQLLWGDGSVTVSTLALEDLGFLGRSERAPEFDEHAWVTESGTALAEQISYDSRTRELEITRVDLRGPKIILARNHEGELPLRRQLDDLAGRAGDRPVVAQAADELTADLPFRYRLGLLTVEEGRFIWLDRLGLYRAKVPIGDINLLLRGASNHPQDKPATLLLNGRPGGFGELQFAGEIDYLNTQKWDANLTGYLLNANLIPATPYIAQLLGFKILQGQMDARFNIIIRANEVDAKAHIILNKTRVRRVREQDQLPIEPSMIPLNVALLLLEDGQQNVTFDMPVTGDLYDPKFTFSFIFSDLLQRAILEALFSYVSPIGFYTLANRAWSRLRWVHFDPVEFAPGSAELDRAAQQQLMEVVEVLRENDKARPGICGIATPRDWHALFPNSTPSLRSSRKSRDSFYDRPPLEMYEQLQRLARLRSRAVNQYLLDNGITADRFIQCAPDYNGKDRDSPRVEFSR